jgi:hypothetical protein
LHECERCFLLEFLALDPKTYEQREKGRKRVGSRGTEGEEKRG